jgi:ribose 5-phosphate isomerase B
MKLLLGCDHAGFTLKAFLKDELEAQGYTVVDVGCYGETDKVDYPNISAKIAEAMQAQGIEKAIITCGSGVGVAIAANRFPWVRAVHAHDAYLAQLSREHNDSNVLTMGGRFVAPPYALQIVQHWLGGTFEGERHAHRVGLLGTVGSYTHSQFQ